MRLLYGIFAIFCFALVSAPAEARRGSGSGEQIELVKDLPDTAAFSDDDGPLDIGYLYTRYSIMGLPISASGTDGKFVLYRGSRYYDMTDELRFEVVRMTGSNPMKNYEFGETRYLWGGPVAVLLVLFGIGGTFLKNAIQKSKNDLRDMESAVDSGRDPYAPKPVPMPEWAQELEVKRPAAQNAPPPQETAALTPQRPVFGRKKI